jgi:large subunit ribosomal protein L25
MADVLNVKRRENLGTANNRRLRKTGNVPAVLYGHGEACIPLAVTSDEVLGVIRHGHKMVKLQGDLAEGAFIKAVQWDTYGRALIHIDLLRVSETEMVETTVTVELKGTAPGVGEGGIVEHVVHELEIECPAASVPEKLVISLIDLHLDGAIHAGEVKLPEGAKLLDDPEMVVVHCVMPHKTEEEEAPLGEPGAAEPELIRKEKEDEEEAAE